MNDLATVDHARVLEERVRDRCQEIRVSWTELASDLYDFHEADAWQTLGYDSFEEWLGSAEIGLGRRHVFTLLAVWRAFIVERGVNPGALARIDATKAREVLPALRRGEVEPRDALSDCEVLSRSDLVEKYRHGPNAALDADSEPQYAKCSYCGSRYRVGQEKAV